MLLISLSALFIDAYVMSENLKYNTILEIWQLNINLHIIINNLFIYHPRVEMFNKFSVTIMHSAHFFL